MLENDVLTLATWGWNEMATVVSKFTTALLIHARFATISLSHYPTNIILLRQKENCIFSLDILEDMSYDLDVEHFVFYLSTYHIPSLNLNHCDCSYVFIGSWAR